MRTINVIGRDAVTAFNLPPSGGELEAGRESRGMREKSARDVQHCVQTIKTGFVSSSAWMAELCSSKGFLPLLPGRPVRLNSLTQTNARTG